MMARIITTGTQTNDDSTSCGLGVGVWWRWWSDAAGAAASDIGSGCAVRPQSIDNSIGSKNLPSATNCGRLYDAEPCQAVHLHNDNCHVTAETLATTTRAQGAHLVRLLVSDGRLKDQVCEQHALFRLFRCELQRTGHAGRTVVVHVDDTTCASVYLLF